MIKYVLVLSFVVFLLFIINYNFIYERFISSERAKRNINSNIDYLNYLSKKNSLNNRVSNIRD